MTFRLTLAASIALAAMPVPAAAANKKTGTQATELDPNGRGAISGIGIESRDIDAMADMVLRDITQRADIMNRPEPPRIIVDHSDFRNESMQRMNAKLVTDALRSSLNRTSAGRVRFINRANMERIMQERELKRDGIADVGTLGTKQGISGSDYFMTANMVSLESRDGKSGIQQRRTQITFELIESETGDIVYTSEPFVTFRAAAEDVVYR
jgi:penicillin-binding protein activator